MRRASTNRLAGHGCKKKDEAKDEDFGLAAEEMQSQIFYLVASYWKSGVN
jgi:hypothetical protein